MELLINRAINYSFAVLKNAQVRIERESPRKKRQIGMIEYNLKGKVSVCASIKRAKRKNQRKERDVGKEETKQQRNGRKESAKASGKNKKRTTNSRNEPHKTWRTGETKSEKEENRSVFKSFKYEKGECSRDVPWNRECFTFTRIVISNLSAKYIYLWNICLFDGSRINLKTLLLNFFIYTFHTFLFIFINLYKLQ